MTDASAASQYVLVEALKHGDQWIAEGKEVKQKRIAIAVFTGGYLFEFDRVVQKDDKITLVHEPKDRYFSFSLSQGVLIGVELRK